MSTVDSIRVIKTKPKLCLLPYRADKIDLSLLNQHLAKNQQQRFDTLRGNRKVEFGVTRLFFSHCLQQSFNLQQDAIEIIEQENLPPIVTYAQEMQLSFSISHSKQLIAILIAEMGSMNNNWGLDVEQYRPIRSRENAKLFCNESQLAVLNNASITEYDEYYYRFWTQKEAVLKAKRTGIIDTDLKAIEGTLCQENQALRSSHFVNPIDENTYAISVFCKENTDSIECQIINLNERLQFSQKQSANLQWQNYRFGT